MYYEIITHELMMVCITIFLTFLIILLSAFLPIKSNKNQTIEKFESQNDLLDDEQFMVYANLKWLDQQEQEQE